MSHINKLKVFNWNYLFFITIIINFKFSEATPPVVKKIFLPSCVYKIESINKNHKSILGNKIKGILNAYNLYYSLYKNNLSEEDIIGICEYIHKYYRYYKIHEKALVIGIYKLILKKNMEGVAKLQCMLHESHPACEYLYLGYLFLCYNEIFNLSNEPIKNLQTFYNIEELLNLIQKNSYQQDFINKFIKIYYIHQYFICEYYFALSIEYIKNNQLIEALLYLRKILVRNKAHPVCALEAILLILEIFTLLDIDLQVKKYFNLILKIYSKNKSNTFMKNYLLRALYILKSKHYLNLIE
jgi:hypothetical protein